MTVAANITSAPIFRIDSFSVPAAARAAFLAQVQETKAFLDRQEGCLQNHVLEHHSGADRFNVVTVVEWESEDAFTRARAAMMEQRKATGFDPGSFLKGLGVEANMSNYTPLP
jgi:heme-degrading monooxygenase HmoA